MKKVVLVFAVALLLAACGDVDGSGSTTTAAAAVAEATVAPVTQVEEGATDDDHTDDADSHEEESADHAADDHADAAVEESVDHAEDDHDDAITPEKDRTVEVAMNEFSFAPGDFEAMAGETIEFVVTNLGVVEHEFRLSNEHRIEEHLASGHADHEDATEGGHHEGGDVILLVQPGETGSITVTFGEDATLYSEVACLIPGHYEAGMKAPMSLST